jgi:hypothetical protein
MTALSEMQDLTGYARERFIQLVPDVQAPAHLSYVLKHKEFSHLKADGSNYQICMCDEEAMQLIQDMYQDMIDAIPGVDYFLVSTDEVYFAGLCEKCGKEYNEKNRSQAWVDYVNLMNKWMSDRGRRMISWIEYPLLPEDILKGKNEIIVELNTTWEKSRFEKCRTVNGKQFIHVLDDVKDHFADRRLGLEYMLAPFERMEIEKWQKQLLVVINDFSKANNLSVEGLQEL